MVVCIWDLASGNQVKTLEGHDDGVWTLCSIDAPNKEVWLASGSGDFSIKLWNISSDRDISGTKDQVVVYTVGQSPQGSQQCREENLGDDFEKTEFMQVSFPRILCGDSANIDGVKGLSAYNRNLLYSVGAISLEESFVKFCEKIKFTKEQAFEMVKCYENGLGLDKKLEKSKEWAQKAASFDQ